MAGGLKEQGGFIRKVLTTAGDILFAGSDGHETRLPLGGVGQRLTKKDGDTVPSWVLQDWVNIRDWGAEGDGVHDDTTAIQNAFDYADANAFAIRIPPGTYKTHTINYRMQSVLGTSTGQCTFRGYPGEDVFHVDSTLTQFYRSNGVFANLTIKVDDTVDAAASFPQRGGVGNACYAVDYPDKLASSPASAVNWHHYNLNFTSTTGNPGAIGGLNNSCGIYTQNNHFTQNFMTNLTFGYLRYGWRDHYPVLNYTPGVTSGISRDHAQVDFLHFIRNGYQWTAWNWALSDVTNIMFHGGPSIVDLDCTWHDMTINGVEMVGNSATQNFFTNTTNVKNTYISCSFSSSVQFVWNENDSYFSGNFNVPAIAFPWLKINGNRNRFMLTQTGSAAANYGFDFVQDLGLGNIVEQGERSSSSLNYKRMAGTPDGNHISRQRDIESFSLGYVDPPFISGRDLLINPRSLRLSSGGPPAATSFDYVTDATADFGVAFRRVPPTGAITFDNNQINGLDGFHIGNFLPAGKIRVYIKQKAAVAGTINWFLQGPIGTTRGTYANSPITTSWSVIWFDADMSAVTPTDTLRLVSGVPAGGASGPIDLAYVMFRPWAKDILTTGNIVGSKTLLSYTFDAGAGDTWLFVADRAYQVISLKEVHRVAGTDAGAVTLGVRKITNVSDPGAAAGANVKEFLTADFDLKSTANTTVTGTLTGTAADLLLATGDKIGLNYTGTKTALAGGALTVELRAI